MPYTSSYRLAYRLHSREQAAATGTVARAMPIRSRCRVGSWNAPESESESESESECQMVTGQSAFATVARRDPLADYRGCRRRDAHQSPVPPS